jgi:hypothetical protein
MIKWTCELLNKINRDDLINICKVDCKKSTLKKDIVNMAFEKIKDDKILSEKLYSEKADNVALHPIEVEKILNITSTERKHFKDKLKIRYYDKCNKFGKTLKVPMYDFIHIYSLTKEEIESWREDYKKIVIDNRKKGVIAAKQTRSENKKKIEDFYKNEWINMLTKWNEIDVELAYTYQFAFWTMWLNRLAKTYQEKASKSTRKSEDYNYIKEHLYELKNDSIKLLSKSKYATISFYQPKYPHKINSTLCTRHYDECRSEFLGNKVAFYYKNQDEIEECEDCSVLKIDDYYSLYYLQLNCEDLPEFTFSFHSPYLLFRDFFGDSSNYKRVQHEENSEGLFRFGRTLTDDETIIFSEKRILKYFNESKDKYAEFLKDKVEIEC